MMVFYECPCGELIGPGESHYCNQYDAAPDIQVIDLSSYTDDMVLVPLSPETECSDEP